MDWLGQHRPVADATLPRLSFNIGASLPEQSTGPVGVSHRTTVARRSANKRESKHGKGPDAFRGRNLVDSKLQPILSRLRAGAICVKQAIPKGKEHAKVTPLFCDVDGMMDPVKLGGDQHQPKSSFDSWQEP